MLYFPHPDLLDGGTPPRPRAQPRTCGRLAARFGVGIPALLPALMVRGRGRAWRPSRTTLAGIGHVHRGWASLLEEYCQEQQIHSDMGINTHKHGQLIIRLIE